jgi:hypothetical protein
MRNREYRYEFSILSNNGYIFWNQIQLLFPDQADDINGQPPYRCLGTKRRLFMKVKTDLKAGRTVNIAKNIAIVRQKGFFNYAEVDQIAVAASS